MQETLGSESVFTKLERIAKLAKDKPDATLTTLAHHIDLEWLREAHRRTRKEGAVGMDGETSEAYEAQLEENLRSLLERAKSGTYRAPPVRRVHIPKGDGKQSRPIGIPTFEDKVLPRAVHMVLEAVYEQDFLDCSTESPGTRGGSRTSTARFADGGRSGSTVARNAETRAGTRMLLLLERFSLPKPKLMTQPA